MAASLVASLVLKLEDQLGGGLTKLTDQLDKLRNLGKTIGLPGLGDKASKDAIELARQVGQVSEQIYRMQQATRDGSAAFEAMGRIARGALAGISEATEGVRRHISTIGGKAHAFGEAGSNLINSGMGAAVEGFAVYEPIKKYAELENIVRHIGITESLSGPALDERIKSLTEFFREDSLKTGQTFESIAQGYQDLTQMGIKADLNTIIQAHSRAATAYNTTTEALGPAVGALIQTMKIPAAGLAEAMAAMAQASKEGRFKIEDFSRELPGVAAQMALLGMTGRKGADITFAALETVMRGSSNPSSAATGLTNVLEYIRTPFADKHFEKQGVNLHAILENGVRKQNAGTGSVLDELLDFLAKRTEKMDLVNKAEFLGKLFHNQTAGSAVLTLMQQRETYEGMKKQLDQVNQGVVDRDFISAFNAPAIQLQVMGNEVEQISTRLGQAFLPVLKVVNFALLDTLNFLKYCQDNFPKTTSAVLVGVAALLALGAALTVLGAVLPLFTTGFGLVASVFESGAAAAGLFSIALRFVAFALASTIGLPVLAVGAAIAVVVGVLGAVLYDIYEHWNEFSGFFPRIWDGIKSVFEGALGFIIGVVSFNSELVLHSLKMMAAGFGDIFGGAWDVVKKIFVDFGAWVDGWSRGLASRILAGIKSGWSELISGLTALVSSLTSTFDNSMLGRLLHLNDQVARQANAQAGPPPAASPDAAPGRGAPLGAPSASPSRVDIHVHTEPGTGVSRVESSDPNVSVRAPISAPPRGGTMALP
jgi:TP901 family phage tail tape measure protein